MKKILAAFLCMVMFSAHAHAQTTPSFIFNLTYTDVEETIGVALAEKGAGKIVSAMINNRRSTPIFSYNKPISVEIRGLQPDIANKRWSANLVILSEGAIVIAMPLAGRYTEMVSIPVLKHAMRLGEVIKDEDLEIKNFATDRTSSDFVNDTTQLIGKTPIRAISPARPIRSHEISEPIVIKKNSTVQMRYKNGGMEISTTGTVLNNGATGSTVSVRNMASKKIVQAVVVDENTVDVPPAGSAPSANKSAS